MAERSFPFDGQSVNEDDWREMARRWLSSGVILGELDNLEPFADSTGMQVKVKSGRAWVEGHYYENDAQRTLALAAADPTNPRKDLVAVRADFTANTITLAVTTGTPAVAPVTPVPVRTSAVWELPIAVVTVGAAVATIAADKVVSQRGWSGITQGLAATADPVLSQSLIGVISANHIISSRVRDSALVKEVVLRVGTSSGNICVAAYDSRGTGKLAAPEQRKFTTGSIPCPAAGTAVVAVSQTVVQAGEWLALAVDNTTATFGSHDNGFAEFNWGRSVGWSNGFPAPVSNPGYFISSRTFALVGR